MSTNDEGCVRPVGKRKRRKSSILICVVVILAMLMLYSLILLAMGYPPKIVIGVAVAVCALATELVRRIVYGGSPEPLRPGTPGDV